MSGHAFRGILIFAALIGVGLYIAVTSRTPPPPRVQASAETYRLIHARGNSETEIARDLSKRECEARKADNKAVAEALGTKSDSLGIGSITCLPESTF